MKLRGATSRHSSKATFAGLRRFRTAGRSVLAGLALRISVPEGSPPSIGITAQPDNRGVRVFAVRPGGAADRAGLGRDDLLIAVDNQSLATEDLNERLRAYPPGASVPFTVERHGRREIINLTLDPPVPNSYSIQELPGATPRADRDPRWVAQGKMNLLR